MRRTGSDDPTADEVSETSGEIYFDFESRPANERTRHSEEYFSPERGIPSGSGMENLGPHVLWIILCTSSWVHAEQRELTVPLFKVPIF